MKAFTEFVGTFLFLFVISLVAVLSPAAAPLAIGGALVAIVYMGGHWSGAQYNPAVSFGLFLQRKIDGKEFVFNVAAQIAAGIIAFWLGYFLTGQPVKIEPQEGYSATKALLVEMIFSMALVLVILNVAFTKKTEGNGFYGVAIGLIIFGAISAGGPISGGAFNPAVGIGATVAWVFNAHGNWSSIWIPIVGPLLGGAVGSFIWSAQEGLAE